MQIHQTHAIVGSTWDGYFHHLSSHMGYTWLIGREGVPGRHSLDGSTWKALHVIFPPLIIPFGWGSHG